MPIYHFNIRDGIDLPDEDGHLLADLETAKRDAMCMAGCLIAEMANKSWPKEDWTMEVTDHDGLILFCLCSTLWNRPL